MPATLFLNVLYRHQAKSTLFISELLLAFFCVHTLFKPVYPTLMHGKSGTGTLLAYALPATIALASAFWLVPQLVSIRFRIWMMTLDETNGRTLRPYAKMPRRDARRHLWDIQACRTTKLDIVPLFFMLYSFFGCAMLTYHHQWYPFHSFFQPRDVNIPSMVAAGVLTLTAVLVGAYYYCRALDSDRIFS